MKPYTFKQRVYLAIHEPKLTRDRGIHYLLIFLIAFSILSVILESVQTISQGYRSFFIFSENLIVYLFSLELLLRLWTVTGKAGYEKVVRGRVKYLFLPLTLLDLAVVVPHFVDSSVLDLRFLRAIRLVGLLSYLELGPFSSSIQSIGEVLHAKRHDIIASLSLILVLMVFTSTIMFYIEHDKQPDVFRDIPSTMLWSAEKYLANGNNSADPQTILGQVCLSFIALLGCAVIGVPSGILVSGFVSKAQKVETVHCPNCSHKFRHRLHIEQ